AQHSALGRSWAGPRPNSAPSAFPGAVTALLNRLNRIAGQHDPLRAAEQRQQNLGADREWAHRQSPHWSREYEHNDEPLQPHVREDRYGRRQSDRSGTQRRKEMTATGKAAVRCGVIVALLLSFAWMAGAAQPAFYAGGVGRNSCGQYLSAFQNRPPGKTRTIQHPEGEFVDEAARYTD